MKFECPHCQQPLECDDDMAGTDVSCPQCNKSLKVPSVRATPTNATASQGESAAAPPPLPPEQKSAAVQEPDSSAVSDWKIPNSAALVFIVILMTIGNYGFLWLTLGYLLVAGLSFLVCRVSKRKWVRVTLSTVVVGVCLIGFFVASFAALVRSEMKKQTDRSIQKTASDLEQDMQASFNSNTLLSEAERERMEFLHAKAMSLVPQTQKDRLIELWSKPIDQLTQDEYAERLRATQAALDRLSPQEKKEFQDLSTRALLIAASQSKDQGAEPEVIPSPATPDAHRLSWDRVQGVLTDTSLTTGQKKRMWERDFQGKRVTWHGDVVMTMMDALNIKFRMNPPFQRAVDVSLFIREDQKAKGDQIYSMRTYQFSGTLDSYPGGVLPVYLKDGVVFTE